MMDIIRRSIVFFILFLVFLFFTQNYFILSLGMNNNNIICKQSERTALLSFKQHLKNSSNSLSSWSGENCCRWDGVVCSNTTDHVVQLHLQELGLGGQLNSSLLGLKQLRYLDLSLNDFEGIRIPEFVGSLQSLRYLNLSRAGFIGMIPHQLGNLSNLRYLDLSYSTPYSDIQLTDVGIFQWISHLSSLKHLDLSGVNVTNVAASSWFRAVNMLPSLLVLRLSRCSLSGALPSSLTHVNFTSLAVLDLGYNNLNSTLPEWLCSLTNLEQLDLSANRFQGTLLDLSNLCNLHTLDLSQNILGGEISGFLGSSTRCIADSLESLDLSYNQLSGPLPNELKRLLNLKSLYLRDNSFSGSIPLSIGRLSLLEVLDLGNNKLNGSLPESLGKLSKLVTLDMTENAFEGVVSEVHFANLTSLRRLVLISLVLKVSPEWVPPFQLLYADLRTCQLGPGFPIWLRTQKNLTSLGLSRTGISGTIPSWFWNFTSTNHFRFDLSHNELHGELPKVINATAISLRSNQFSGQLPRVSSNVRELDLSSNSFSGPISIFLCNHVSNNSYTLDLSDNLLSGNLSDCWDYWASLGFLSLGGNKITGNIPTSMGGSLPKLRVLHLSNNRLSGELPLSLKNCTSLSSMDLGENEFTGILPIWLGESLSGLQYLRLRSNKFYGEIPLELCHLASIQVLDIAHNDLRGSIPRCFNNFGVLTTKWHSYGFGPNTFGEYVEKTQLVVKRRELDYYSIVRALVTSLDLSNNSLSGEIPEELTSLIGLISLNLSENHFTGKIPEKIGNMNSLESLDFSRNRISGVIPQSISGLSSLSYLDLSYNNLSGKIPLGTQLQGFNESSFIGNQELCGHPLKNCIGEESPQKPGDFGDRTNEDEVWLEMKWFYMSMGVGFVLGFWVFCGVLVFKKSWRFAYFQFLDDMKLLK